MRKQSIERLSQDIEYHTARHSILPEFNIDPEDYFENAQDAREMVSSEFAIPARFVD